MSNTSKQLNRCNLILTVILVIDIIAFMILGFQSAGAKLRSNEEVWVTDTNRSEVQEFAASLNFPQDNIVRVVYISGLGDGEAVFYYKNTILSTGYMTGCYDKIFTKYGEIEGTRKTKRAFVVTAIIFFIALIGKKIIRAINNLD